MNRKEIFHGLCSGVLCLTLGIFATNSVMAEGGGIAALEIDGLHQVDGNGLYDQIISSVGNAAGATFSVKTLPPNRAFKEFESGNVACITPANTNPDFYQFAFQTIQSSIMTDAKIYIFTKTGSTPFTNLSDLKGKKVGVRSGLPLGNRIEGSGLKLIKAKTIEANIKKLQAGRIDAFLAYWPDVYTSFENLKMDKLPHAVDGPVANHPDTILCRDDAAGKKIVEQFNQGFAAIEANGELAKLLGE